MTFLAVARNREERRGCVVVMWEERWCKCGNAGVCEVQWDQLGPCFLCGRQNEGRRRVRDMIVGVCGSQQVWRGEALSLIGNTGKGGEQHWC